MRRFALCSGLLACFAIVGCGDSKPKLQTGALTDEQKQQIKAADQAIDDEERSGSGTSTRKKK